MIDVTKLDGAVIPLETAKFKGEVHFDFDKKIGKHGLHRYWVRYIGEFKDPNAKMPSNGELELLDVYPFQQPVFKMAYGSGKNLMNVLAKNAPSWVPVEKLQPTNEMFKEGISIHTTGELDEKLAPSMGLSAYIDDFVHSKNSRFDGKSKEQRIQMAKGAYYSAMKNESIDPATPPPPVISNHVSLTPELLLRLLEWAKENAGEDIQLHKLVEIVEQMGRDGILVSNCYENIIAQITPNDPTINDNGPQG